MTFNKNIIGHYSIRHNLFSRINSNNLNNSLLLTGPNSIGKRKVALELAQRELCLNKNICGKCQICLLFNKNYPTELTNLLRITPNGKAGFIKIGMIRDNDLTHGGVIQWAYRTSLPTHNRWIVIEDAHRLNTASANILLKTIEEPPNKTHFLLITHRPNILPQTISSRCERIIFNHLSDNDIWQIASNAKWDIKQREQLLALSNGTLRYLDKTSFDIACLQLKAWISLVESQSIRDDIDILLPKKNINLSQNEQFKQNLEILLLILRDIVHHRHQKLIRLLPWKNKIKSLDINMTSINNTQRQIFKALSNIQYNLNYTTIIMEIIATLKL